MIVFFCFVLSVKKTINEFHLYFSLAHEEKRMSSSSPPSAIIRPLEAVPNISGLSRPPDTFGTSIPAPGPPIKNFGTQLPRSREEARRRAIRSSDGKSLSQNKIVYNIILHHWDEDYHMHIFEGQPVFAMVMSGILRAPLTIPILNLRQINSLYDEQFNKALELLESDALVENEYLTADELEILRSTPTVGWASLPFLHTLLGDDTKSAFHTVRYLWEEGIRDRFNFYGFALGQIAEGLSRRITAVSRAGSIDSIENCWGDQVENGDQLYFIFKRKHFGGGRFGGFAYHPWFGKCQPTYEDICYPDMTGVLREGQVIYVGDAGPAIDHACKECLLETWENLSY